MLRRRVFGVSFALVASFSVAATTPAVAQPSADLIMAGDRETLARRPASALPFFKKALEADPRNYVALWKACRELVDLGEYEKDVTKRTAMYARAVDYAKRAIAWVDRVLLPALALSSNWRRACAAQADETRCGKTLGSSTES